MLRFNNNLYNKFKNYIDSGIYRISSNEVFRYVIKVNESHFMN